LFSHTTGLTPTKVNDHFVVCVSYILKSATLQQWQ
jgi:hypothetical protein